MVDTPGERLSLDLASRDAREYYRSNILATLDDMSATGVYLDFGVLAFGTPNWRAARVAVSSDYLQFEESISAGIQAWAPPRRRGVLVANSPGNPIADANFNELGGGVWTNPRAVSMSLQEGKLLSPPGAMPSHIYCYDKRLFVAFGAATGSAPAFRPDNATQFDVRTPDARCARTHLHSQLRDAMHSKVNSPVQLVLHAVAEDFKVWCNADR